MRSKTKKILYKDYLEQKLVKNNGELDYIIIYNNHEPIISKDNWNKAQNILKERRRNMIEELDISDIVGEGK